MSVTSRNNVPSTFTMKVPTSLMPEPLQDKSSEDTELWLKHFDQYALSQGWPESQKVCYLLCHSGNRPKYGTTIFLRKTRRAVRHLCAALLRSYQPHRSIKWTHLKQFQDRRQANELEEDYFQTMHKKGKHLAKIPADIMETIVSGLALTASVLQQDSTSEKAHIALAVKVLVSWCFDPRRGAEKEAYRRSSRG